MGIRSKISLGLPNAGVEAERCYFNNPDNHFLALPPRWHGGRRQPASIYIAYNGWQEMVTATLPQNLPGKRWFRVSDTAAWMEERDNFNEPAEVELMTGATYGVTARSVLILIEK